MRQERALLLADGRAAVVFSHARRPSLLLLEPGGGCFTFFDGSRATPAPVTAVTSCTRSALRPRMRAALEFRNRHCARRGPADASVADAAARSRPYTPDNLFEADYVSVGGPLSHVLRWPVTWDLAEARCRGSEDGGGLWLASIDGLWRVTLPHHGQRVLVDGLSPLVPTAGTAPTTSEGLGGGSGIGDAGEAVAKEYQYVRVRQEFAVDEVPVAFQHAFVVLASKMYGNSWRNEDGRIVALRGRVSEAISVDSSKCSDESGSYVSSELEPSHLSFAEPALTWTYTGRGKAQESEALGLLRIGNPSAEADPVLMYDAEGRRDDLVGTRVEDPRLAGLPTTDLRAPISAFADLSIPPIARPEQSILVDESNYFCSTVHTGGKLPRVEVQVTADETVLILRDDFVHIFPGTADDEIWQDLLADGRPLLFEAVSLPSTSRLGKGVTARHLLHPVVAHARRLLGQPYVGSMPEEHAPLSLCAATLGETRPSYPSGSPKAVVERCEVAGFGVFTMFGDGRVRATFTDATIVTMTPIVVGLSPQGDRCELLLGKDGAMVQMDDLSGRALAKPSRELYLPYILPVLEFREWGSMTPAERAAAAAHRDAVAFAASNARDRVQRFLDTCDIMDGKTPSICTPGGTSAGAAAKESLSAIDRILNDS